MWLVVLFLCFFPANADGFAVAWVDPVRGDGDDGLHDEGAFHAEWVRDGEVVAREQEVAVVDDVDVEGAWAPVDNAFTLTGGFDVMNGIEEFVRRKQGFNENGAVEEAILIGVADGVGFDPWCDA